MPSPPPRPSPPKSSPTSWLSIFLAGILAVVAIAILLVLSLGTFGPVLAMGGVIFLLVGVHYVIWGWWLGSLIHREEENWDDS